VCAEMAATEERDFQIGDAVRIESVGAYLNEKLVYAFWQRGLVTDTTGDFVSVRVVAAPPNYPYQHPLHDKVVQVSKGNLSFSKRALVFEQ
jgi:hypothetical protein